MLKVRDLMVNIIPEQINQSGVDAQYLNCGDCTCGSCGSCSCTCGSCGSCSATARIVDLPIDNKSNDLMSQLQEQLKVALTA